MIAHGAAIQNVSKMLGHTDIKMTQRYAEVLAKDVYDDFEMVEKKLKKNPYGLLQVLILKKAQLFHIQLL